MNSAASSYSFPASGLRPPLVRQTAYILSQTRVFHPNALNIISQKFIHREKRVFTDHSRDLAELLSAHATTMANFAVVKP